jgi:predicted Zn-dependent protease
MIINPNHPLCINEHVFQSRLVLASSEPAATDDGYDTIFGVIGHDVFLQFAVFHFFLLYLLGSSVLIFVRILCFDIC